MTGQRRLGGLVLIVLAGWAFIPQASGQDAQDQRGPRSGRDGGRGGFRRDGRGRGGPPTFTSEDRERMYDRMVDRYMERLSGNYELNEQQQAQVRSKLEEVKTQQRAYSDSRRQEMDSLREQMRQLRENRSGDEEADRQKFRQLGEQMRTFWENAPLMNSQQVTAEVEKLLPAEQVEKGRARHAQHEAEQQQRREEMSRRFDERRRQFEEDRQNGEDQGPSRREEMRQRWMERRPRDDDDSNQDGPPFRMLGSDQQVQPLPENPIGPWEQYVRDFNRRYQLDPAQRGTAQSVLREMQERRTAYEQMHRVDFEAARTIEDAGQRDQKLTELNRPVVDLFEKLKTRLLSIPTAAQRQLGGGSASATQPATASTRPAFFVTTRPASEGGAAGSDRSSRDRRRSGRDRGSRPEGQ